VPEAIPLFSDASGAINEISPVGVPEVDVTVAAALADVRWVIVTADVLPFTVSAVVVGLSPPTAVAQAFAKFATLKEPNPVA